MSIQCSPTNLASWNFNLSGPDGEGTASFNWFSEKGGLTINGTQYEIIKDGFLSGQWRLVLDGKTLYTALKPNPFTRRFEISGQGLQSELKSQTLGRTMTFTGNKGSLTIAPKHPFTRRSSISGSPVDFELAGFAFWLCVLTWRRNRNRRSSMHNNGGS